MYEFLFGFVMGVKEGETGVGDKSLDTYMFLAP